MFGTLRAGRMLSRASLRVHASASLAPRSLAFRGHLINLQSPLRVSAQNFHSSIRQLQEAAPAPGEISERSDHLSTFQELTDHGLVSPRVTNTITNKMGITTMTDVQRLTINETLDGADVIAQAKTGTGKTIAFLMPIIQRLLKDEALERRSHGGADVNIRALIISPTRELAEQIAQEAKTVVSATNIRVQTAVGGANKREALQRLKREGCHLLVGTPGRVKDLLSDKYSGVDVSNVEMFVLDEADRLLDIGFAPDIEEIQSYMPHVEEKPRQTLMFSATVPRSVVDLVRQTLRPDFKFVRTTDPNEQPTHETIPQKVAFVRGFENQLPALFEIAYRAIKAHQEDPANTMPFKAIVYLPSTAEVALSHEIFRNMRGSLDASSQSNFVHPLAPAEMIEMHSRLTQMQRTRNSARFHSAKSAILFSSDVTARGMHFPNVSHVIQLGLPRHEEDYIHRLGRTGRAGKTGEGWLLVHEQNTRDFRRKLGQNLPIEQDQTLKTVAIDMSRPAELPADVAAILDMIKKGYQAVPYESKSQAYASMFGVLQQIGQYRDKQLLVDDLNALAKYGWGCEEIPAISPSMAAKLGLRGLQGLNFDRTRERTQERTQFGDKGDRRGNRRDTFQDDLPFETRTRSRPSPRDGLPFGRDLIDSAVSRSRPQYGGRTERSPRGRFDSDKRGGRFDNNRY